MLNKRLIKITYLLILIVSFIKIYSSIFDTKLSLVGDNTSYYILGNSIASGEGYSNIHHLGKEQHYHYPPGYPLLIATIIKFTSNSVEAIKIFNGILFISAILILFFIIKKLTNNLHIAFISCLVSLFNFHLLAYSTIVMSEIPFLFMSLLCFWILLKIKFTQPVIKNTSFLVFIVLVSFSFYIRSIAITLFLSFVLLLLLKRNWKYLLISALSFVLLYLPWIIRNRDSTGSTYLNQLILKNPYQPELGNLHFHDIFERFFINLERYITKEIPYSLFSTNNTSFDYENIASSDWLTGFLILLFIGFGLYSLKNYRKYVLSYILCFLSLLLLWPYVWYGSRFILPIIPFLTFLLIFGLFRFINILLNKFKLANTENTSLVLILILVSSYIFFFGAKSITTLKHQAKSDYATNYKNYFTIANWIDKNTESNSVTCVRKQGLFYMFSNKYVTNYKNTLDKEEQIEYLKNKNVDYVVIEQLGYSSTYKYLLPVIDRYPEKFKIIKELKNPNTYLMQFLPELGYSGDWKDEKRNGFGTYIWEDGQKYVGYWKDNLRHGKGVVYFKNGEFIEGTWVLGKLNGLVIKKDSKGYFLEKSMYKDNIKLKIL